MVDSRRSIPFISVSTSNHPPLRFVRGLLFHFRRNMYGVQLDLSLGIGYVRSFPTQVENEQET